MSLDESKNLRGKTIAIVSRDKPDMILQTPFHVAMLGGLPVYYHMVYSGNKIVKENNIEDPFFLTAQKLRDELVKTYGLKIVDGVPSKKITSYNVNKISDSYRGIADYVIDIRDLRWMLNYVSRDLSSYAVAYSSQMKFIDVKNSQVIAENSCVATPYNNYPKDFMLADGAKVLKKELVGAVDACSKFFKDSILKKKVSNPDTE